MCNTEGRSHKKNMVIKPELLKSKEQRSQQWNEKIWTRYGEQNVHEVWVRAKGQPSTMERPCRLRLYSKLNLVLLSISKDSQLGPSESWSLFTQKTDEEVPIIMHKMQCACSFYCACMYSAFAWVYVCVTKKMSLCRPLECMPCNLQGGWVGWC